MKSNWIENRISVLFCLLLLLTTGCKWFDGGKDDPIELPSDLNGIVSLTVSEGSLSPEFSIVQTDYSVDVDNSIDSIQITATVEDTSVTLQINGEATSSGTASSAITLDVGATTILVTATSESGLSRTVTINVNRAEAISNNSQLDNLTISNGELSPAFSSTTDSYTVTVTSNVDSVTVTPTTANANATVKMDDVVILSGSASQPIAVAVGTTTITMIVTAQDGTTTSSYTIALTRDAPLSNDADLSGLSLSAASVSPSFSADNLAYTASVSFTTTSITTTATLADSTASVTVNGELTQSGVASSVIALQEGSNTITYIVLAEDGVTTKTYTLIITRQVASTFAQIAYIKASNTDEGDQFGYFSSLSGDTLAVVSINEASNATGIDGDQSDNSAPGSGAVFIFVRDAQGLWTQQAYIKASNAEQNDGFSSISLQGDRLIVGAGNESSAASGLNGDQSDNSLFRSGAVYEFVRGGEGTWIQVAYIKLNSPKDRHYFGAKVSLSGNLLAVSATGDGSGASGIDGDEADTTASNSGAVYIFENVNGDWIQKTYIKASNPDKDDIFGRHIVLKGNSLVVAAPAEQGSSREINGEQNNFGGFHTGAVYAYRRDANGVWSQEAYIKPSNLDRGDYFGFSIGLSGDTLVVGSKNEDGGSTGVNGDETDNSVNGAGAAYVFVRSSNGDWSQQAYLKPSTIDAADIFGTVVEISGDTAAVTSLYDDSNATGIDGDQSNNSLNNAGAVFVFKRDSNHIWSQTHYVKASNTDSNYSFGNSLNLSVDTLVVGAPEEDGNSTGINGDQGDNSAPNSGAVYVFDID